MFRVDAHSIPCPAGSGFGMRKPTGPRPGTYKANTPLSTSTSPISPDSIMWKGTAKEPTVTGVD